MSISVSAITDPIALCAYVAALVFGMSAKRWNSKSKQPRARRLFYLAASVAVLAPAGGMFPARQRSPRPQPAEKKP